MNIQSESTYGMLVRSEEKGRGILKILVYAAVILTVVLSIWQFAETPSGGPCAWNRSTHSMHTTKTQLRVGR